MCVAVSSEYIVLFCHRYDDRRYVTSTIIGATTMEQLKENLDAFTADVTLSEETLKAVDEVHLSCRDPSQLL